MSKQPIKKTTTPPTDTASNQAQTHAAEEEKKRKAAKSVAILDQIGTKFKASSKVKNYKYHPIEAPKDAKGLDANDKNSKTAAKGQFYNVEIELQKGGKKTHFHAEIDPTSGKLKTVYPDFNDPNSVKAAMLSLKEAGSTKPIMSQKDFDRLTPKQKENLFKSCQDVGIVLTGENGQPYPVPKSLQQKQPGLNADNKSSPSNQNNSSTTQTQSAEKTQATEQAKSAGTTHATTTGSTGNASTTKESTAAVTESKSSTTSDTSAPTATGDKTAADTSLNVDAQHAPTPAANPLQKKLAAQLPAQKASNITVTKIPAAAVNSSLNINKGATQRWRGPRPLTITTQKDSKKEYSDENAPAKNTQASLDYYQVKYTNEHGLDCTCVTTVDPTTESVESLYFNPQEPSSIEAAGTISEASGLLGKGRGAIVELDKPLADDEKLALQRVLTPKGILVQEPISATMNNLAPGTTQSTTPTFGN